MAVILSDLTLERASQRKNAAFLLVYLFWAVLGVTLANESMVRDRLASRCASKFESADRLSIMMCVELRIRCSQPPSREFSGSLLTFAEPRRTSPELRRQLAVILSDLTLERASQRKNAAFLLVYLFRAFSGVTLPEQKRYAIEVSITYAPGPMKPKFGWVSSSTNGPMKWQRQALQTIFGGHAGEWPGIFARKIGEFRGVEFVPITFEVADDLACWRARPEVGRAHALSGPTTPAGKRYKPSIPLSEVGPGHVATWGQSVELRTNGFGFEWVGENWSSKHIPFDWSGPDPA